MTNDFCNAMTWKTQLYMTQQVSWKKKNCSNTSAKTETIFQTRFCKKCVLETKKTHEKLHQSDTGEILSSMFPSLIFDGEYIPDKWSIMVTECEVHNYVSAKLTRKQQTLYQFRL